MGSSIVIIFSFRCKLIRLSIAAEVVDFPEPVGPVISINPLLYSQASSTTGGISNSSTPGRMH